MSDTAGLIAFYRMRLEIQKALSRFCSETELWQQICDAAVATGEIQLAWIGLRRQSRLRPVAAAAQPASLLTRAWPCPDIGLPLLASQAVATGTPQWHGPQDALPPRVAVAGFSSACALPLTIEGELYGVMEFYARPADFFTPERQALLADLPAEVEAVLARRADLQRRNYQLRRIAALAYRDPLTGLPNRRYLEVYLPRVLVKARRKSRPLALFMMDLDGFKGVNDRFGHAVGDRLLIQVAAVLRRRLRRGDLLVRLGGGRVRRRRRQHAVARGRCPACGRSDRDGGRGGAAGAGCGAEHRDRPLPRTRYRCRRVAAACRPGPVPGQGGRAALLAALRGLKRRHPARGGVSGSSTGF